MPIVAIPAAYRGPTRGEGEVETSGATVLDCLEEVEQSNPGFLPLVLDERGGIRRYVKLFVNCDQIDAGSLGTRVEDGDRVEVLAVIAGG
jgi:sulfur carrier protein ThiS